MRLEQHTYAAAEELDHRLMHVSARCFPSALGSRSQASAAIKRGDLVLNGEAAEGCRLVRSGDVLSLTVRPPRLPQGRALAARVRFVQHSLEQGLRAVYEDDEMAVVYKPAGVHTKHETNPKYGAFEDALPAVLSLPAAKHALPLPLAVHRLDVRVCGLVLVAKTRPAAASLSLQLQQRVVNKTYHALLLGEPRGVEVIETAVDGLEARTRLSLLSSVPHGQWGALSLARLHPSTGRTHQLRVHCASLGAPIVGDDLYHESACLARVASGDPPLPPVKQGGLYLMSTGVSFQHPRTTKATVVEIPLHAKFGRLMDRATRAAERGGASSGG